MFFWSPYELITIPFFLLSLWASARVQSTFRKYAQYGTRARMTGAQVARRILDEGGLHHVEVVPNSGFLSDHYDPMAKRVALSPDVYNGRSVSAVGVAAHETGHALQHAAGYFPVLIRSMLVPVAQIGSYAGPLLFFFGLFFLQSPFLAKIGLFVFAGAVLFAVVTLPVEFDASWRALAVLREGGYVTVDEHKGVKSVLTAAAMTYVAGALMALAELLKFIFYLRAADRGEQ